MFAQLQRRFKSRFGFTLLELSIVVSAIALMMVAILPAITQDQIRRRDFELNYRMDQIEMALQKFVQLNNRLPCPAPRGYGTSHASFGLETTLPGACNTPFASVLSSFGFVYLRVGNVPTRTLGLPDDYGYDPWDRAISYIIDINTTRLRALNYYYPLSDVAHGASQPSAVAPPLTNITVRDVQWSAGTTSVRTSAAILVLVSHGPNGHGGYVRAGNTSTSVPRYNVGVTNAYELANCNCTAAVADSAAGTFYAAIPAPNVGALLNSYDDRVRYYTRGSFVTNSERQLP